MLPSGNPDEGTESGLTMDEAVTRLLAVEAPEGQPDAAQEEAAPVEDQEEAEDPASTEPEQQEDEGAEDTPPARKFTVKVDGKDVEVDETELLSSYSRTADYTRKTMALAEQRKAVEAEAAAIQQERAYYSDQLKSILQEAVSSKETEPDWASLAANDPIGYVQTKAAWDAKQEKLRKTYEAYEMIQRQNAEQEEKAHRANLQRQAELLTEMVPEWKDGTKAKAEKQAVAEYLLGYGYAPEVVSNLGDATAVVLARKAFLYDQMMAKQATVQKRVVEAPKMVPAGAAKPNVGSERVKQLETQLKRSGRVDDAVALLMARQKGR